ncbi:hypothetical protein WDU94_010565 [Cyamophila willieti]
MVFFIRTVATLALVSAVIALPNSRSKREEAAAAAAGGSNPLSSFSNLGNNPLQQFSGSSNPLSQYAPQGFDQYVNQFGNIPSNFPGLGQSSTRSKREEAAAAAAGGSNPLSQLSNFGGNNPLSSMTGNNPLSQYAPQGFDQYVNQFGNIPSNFPGLGQSSTRSKREEAAAAAAGGSNPLSSFSNLGNNPLQQFSGSSNPLSQYAPQGFDQYVNQFGNIPSNFPGLGQSSTRSKREEAAAAAAGSSNPLSQLSNFGGNNPLSSMTGNNPLSQYAPQGFDQYVNQFGNIPSNFPGLGQSSTRSKREEAAAAAAGSSNPLSQLSNFGGNNPLSSMTGNNPLSQYAPQGFDQYVNQFGNIPSNFPGLGQSSTRSKREEAAAAAAGGSNPLSSFSNLGNNPLQQFSGSSNPLSQYAPQGLDQYVNQFGNIPSNFPGMGQSSSSSS